MPCPQCTLLVAIVARMLFDDVDDDEEEALPRFQYVMNELLAIPRFLRGEFAHLVHTPQAIAGLIIADRFLSENKVPHYSAASILVAMKADQRTIELGMAIVDYVDQQWDHDRMRLIRSVHCRVITVRDR